MMTLSEALAMPDAVAMLAVDDGEKEDQAWKAAFFDLLYAEVGDECWIENFMQHGQLTPPYEDCVTVALQIRSSRRTGTVSESKWVVAVMTATPRASDGRLYWKKRQLLVRKAFGTTCSAELVDEAEAFAESRGLHFDYNLYEGQTCR